MRLVARRNSAFLMIMYRNGELTGATLHHRVPHALTQHTDGRDRGHWAYGPCAPCQDVNVDMVCSWENYEDWDAKTISMAKCRLGSLGSLGKLACITTTSLLLPTQFAF